MKETLSPTSIYQKSQDKQRVVITGDQAGNIAAMVIFVLKKFGREFDFITSTDSSGISNAPLIIIQDTPGPALLEYHHHIGVLSDMASPPSDILSRFADLTPKGGVLIFSDAEPLASIGKKERSDMTSISYTAYPHAIDNGKVALVSSKNMMTPVYLSGGQNLRNISAAREILKKVGISSDQFYHAISSFRA